ncbi:MAG: hypothetical protein EXR82_07560 [Gammaproteobacteria bacterium]|nr:hypothetical protein [Gammaproteobacteria bacterium]
MVRLKETGRVQLIDHDRLVNDTDSVLSELSGFLKLKTPFTAEYKTTRFTGVRGKGDRSVYLQAGTILKDIQHRDELVLDDLRIETLRRQYESIMDEFG